jgi:hypothetical protein
LHKSGLCDTLDATEITGAAVFEKLRSMLGRSTSIEAATQLKPAAPPKVKDRDARTYPSFFTTTKPAADPLPRTDRRLVNSDILALRNGRDTFTVTRNFVAASPELSSAVYTGLRIGIPERYTGIARNMDGSFNPEATNLLQQLLTRFDVVGNYEDGFSGTWSLKSVSESLAREALMYGSMACEVVLGKDRLPARLQPVSVTQIQFIPDGKMLKPIQILGQDEIDLDVPTFFYTSLDQDLLDPYSTSPLEPALKAVVFSETFIADLQRILSRVIHPRQKVVIDEDKFRKNMTPAAQVDEEEARKEMATLLNEIENKVNNLNPEDALVYFDSLGFEVENTAASGLSAEYTVLRDISNARLASGAKTMPSVLGLSAGQASSNIASTEAAIYLKSIDGAVRQKLNEIYSRMLTLCLRLFGLDVYVKFQYEAISLRSEPELEAFLQTRQMRILEQLSLGLVSDEEASLALTGKLPPLGYVPKSGTMFKQGGVGGGGGADTQEPSNSGSTFNQQSESDAPTRGRGQNTEDKGRGTAQVVTLGAR